MTGKAPYRSARVRVRVSSVDIIDLKTTPEKARALAWLIREAKEELDVSHDNDVVDMLIASLHHEIQSYRSQE